MASMSVSGSSDTVQPLLGLFSTLPNELLIPNIISLLEPKHFAKCRLLSKTWKIFLHDPRVFFVYCKARQMTKTGFMWSMAMGDGVLAQMFIQVDKTLDLKYALRVAAYQGFSATVIDLLLGKGIDVDLPDDTNMTLLHKAALGGHPNTVRHLLARGADINSQDHQRYTPLHTACASGNVGAVGVLLEKKPQILRDMDGNTASAVAEMNGHTEVLLAYF